MKLRKIAASVLAAAVAFSTVAFSASAEEAKDEKLTLLSADLTAKLQTNMIFVEGIGIVDITGADFDSSENGYADEDANLDVDFDGIAYLSKENLKNWKETGVLELSKLKADFDTTGLKWGMFHAQNGYVQLVKMEKQKVEDSEEEEDVVTYRGLYKIENGEIKKCCDLDTFWTATRADGVSIGFKKEYATIHYKTIYRDYETNEIETSENDADYFVGLKLVVTQPDGTKKETTIAKAPFKEMSLTADYTDENFDWANYYHQYDGMYYFDENFLSMGFVNDTIYANLILHDNFEVLENDFGFEIYECDLDGNVKKIFEANEQYNAAAYGGALIVGDVYYWFDGAPATMGWSNFCIYDKTTGKIEKYNIRYDETLDYIYPKFIGDNGKIIAEIYSTEEVYDEDHHVNFETTSLGYAAFDNLQDIDNWQSKTYYEKIVYQGDTEDGTELFRFVTKDGKTGYMDINEKVIAEFDATDGFAGKYAPVVKGGKAYLIDEKMNAVSIEIEADDVVAVDEDLFLAKKGDKTYFVTYGGEVEDPATEVVVVDYSDNGVTASANEGVIADGAALSVKAVEDKTDATKVTYEISFKKADGTTVQPNGGKVTVKIPVPEAFKDKTVYVYRVEADGKYTNMNAKVENGVLVFETEHFSEYVISTDGTLADTTESSDSESSSDNSPNTGFGGIAMTLGIFALAGAAVVAARKRK